MIIQRQCLNISLTYSFIENDKAAEEPHTKSLFCIQTIALNFLASKLLDKEIHMKAREIKSPSPLKSAFLRIIFSEVAVSSLCLPLHLFC